ncbi:MAG: hypothetical protein IJU35_03800 [Paludibacteraceae bacterium]|nr:hypothetical protein [Paludibacteraceae bacterium]
MNILHTPHNHFGTRRKPYASPRFRIIHLHLEQSILAGTVHVGDDFIGNDDISAGNSVGDGYWGEDLGTDGGINAGNSFWGEDLFYTP